MHNRRKTCDGFGADLAISYREASLGIFASYGLRHCRVGVVRDYAKFASSRCHGSVSRAGPRDRTWICKARCTSRTSCTKSGSTPSCEGGVRAYGQSRDVLPVDVSDASAVDAAATRIEEEFGPIDIWVNNAMVSVFWAQPMPGAGFPILRVHFEVAEESGKRVRA